MTESPNNVAPAGWYVDPMTRRHLRWWNGQAWTESVAPLPGVAPTAYVAPAPRVQQRFALGASDEQTQAAATQTQVAAERFQQPAQAFVTQVPETIAQPAQPVQQPAVNVQPAIPWPAVKPADPEKPSIQWPDDADSSDSSAPASAAQAASHYKPQYGSVTESLLKSTNPSDLAATPSYHRTQTGAIPVQAAAELSTDDSAKALEDTLMSRRQLRDRKEAEAAVPSSAPRTSTVTQEADGPDLWAGPDDRHADASPGWQPAGGERARRDLPVTPRHWGTASVWLLTITPWLGALAMYVALALFTPWSLQAIGVMLLPWLVGLLFAQQDATRLRELGHDDVARPLWAALTAPVYLVARTLSVRRTMGGGTAPLLVWALNAVVVVAVIGALALMPALLPASLVEAVEPLRETVGAWFTPGA